MTAPLFGLLIVDRDPATLADLPGLAQAWLMDAGGFAMLGLAVYLLYALRLPKEQAASARDRAGVSGLMLGAAVAAILCYAVYGFLLFTGNGIDQTTNTQYTSDPGAYRKYEPPKLSLRPQPLALTLGGLCALVGIAAPFVGSLIKLRSRRVFAIAKLGFKEAVRNRLFLVFLLFLLPFLFPANWFVPIKPEDELRTMIGISSLFTNLLLTLPAALLAAMSIPNDIKNQNIYTIVTKPVERFELILGRFVGYAGLMTAALFAMTLLGWLLISFGTTIDDKAKEETFKARVPQYGKLSYQSRRGVIEGINAGREFDYRKYIGGSPATSQRAVWSFDRVPSTLSAAGREVVPVEFTFDIFRMTKGEENRGVDLDIRVTSWQAAQQPPAEPKDGTWRWLDADKEQAYQKEAAELVRTLPGVSAAVAQQNPAVVLALAKPGTEAWKVVDQLAEKYGFYEARGKEIFDYHPDSIPVPGGLFRFAARGSPAAGPDGKPAPRVTVAVKCNTGGQMLGMAAPDLFLLEGDRTFSENYFKAAVGLWCRVVLIIGLAVTCSTYLAGIISFLAAILLFVGGYASDHLTDMASGRSYVGGPFKALGQLLRAEQTTALEDPNSALTAAVTGLDQVSAWMFRRVINMVPDVYAYSWTSYLSEGFNIPATALLMNLVVLAGYLLPWFILGYYLIRSREVAA